MDWERVILFFTAAFSLVANTVRQVLVEANIQVVTDTKINAQLFDQRVSQSVRDEGFRRLFKQLDDAHTRIVIVVANNRQKLEVALAAKAQGRLIKGWAWVGHNYIVPDTMAV